jgi:hypothetical protein
MWSHLQITGYVTLLEPHEVLRCVLTHSYLVWIEYIEVVKCPKGFLLMALPLKVMGFLVNFR